MGHWVAISGMHVACHLHFKKRKLQNAPANDLYSYIMHYLPEKSTPFDTKSPRSHTFRQYESYRVKYMRLLYKALIFCIFLHLGLAFDDFILYNGLSGMPPASNMCARSPALGQETGHRNRYTY